MLTAFLQPDLPQAAHAYLALFDHYQSQPLILTLMAACSDCCDIFPLMKSHNCGQCEYLRQAPEGSQERRDTLVSELSDWPRFKLAHSTIVRVNRIMQPSDATGNPDATPPQLAAFAGCNPECNPESPNATPNPRMQPRRSFRTAQPYDQLCLQSIKTSSTVSSVSSRAARFVNSPL